MEDNPALRKAHITSHTTSNSYIPDFDVSQAIFDGFLSNNSILDFNTLFDDDYFNGIFIGEFGVQGADFFPSTTTKSFDITDVDIAAMMPLLEADLVDPSTRFKKKHPPVAEPSSPLSSKRLNFPEGSAMSSSASTTSYVGGVSFSATSVNSLPSSAVKLLPLLSTPNSRTENKIERPPLNSAARKESWFFPPVMAKGPQSSNIWLSSKRNFASSE